MRLIRFGSILGLLVLAGTLASSRADGPDWFPFVIPWDDAPDNLKPTATDVSALSPTPAGADGFISARDGHFYDGKGRRIRFLGVNFTRGANFPDKKVAEKVAARLRKYGINMVRLVSLDYHHAPEGIFDPAFKDRQHLDERQLDRLDYLVAQLKKNGIYVNLTLHVGRHPTEADGFTHSPRLPAGGGVIGYFEPRVQRLHRDYARDLLTHKNPYTGTRYVEEPAVATMELTNEDTLVAHAWRNTLDELPPPYRDELARQWNAWLKGRYVSTVALKQAWQGGAALTGPSLMQNGDFTRGTTAWRIENNPGARSSFQVAGAVPVPKEAVGRTLRVEIAQPGTQAWHVQVHQAGLEFRDGETYTVTFWAKADRQRPLLVSADIGQGDYRNVGLRSSQTVGTDWQPYRVTFRATKPVRDQNRLLFALGTAAGTLDLAAVAVRPGTGEGLPATASLEAGTIPVGRLLRGPVGRDWVGFLIDAEGRYSAAMQDFVKKELGARANVTCSQASYGQLAGIYRERQSDYIDMHNYWQHPRFPRREWDPVDWYVPNTPMTKDRAGGALAPLARFRMAGKPFSVSEYGHPAPSSYQAECVPMLASFAAFQDWDAVYLFDYHSDRDGWDSNRIRGFFAIDSNPTQMAFLPAAAMLFRRGDVAPAEGECQLRIPEASVADIMADRNKDVTFWWEQVRTPALETLTRRLSLALVPGKGDITVSRTGPAAAQPALRWTGQGTDDALYTVDAPRSKVMVGFLGGRKVELPGWQVQMARTDSNFAALALTARDANPIRQSRGLLLTAVGRVENTNMGWNAQRNSVGRNWGDGPTRAEGIPATVTLATEARTAAVWALDGSGRRQRQVDCRLAGGQLTFAIGPAHRTLWYEIEIDGERVVGN